jgi:Zn-dependent protease with chaperone function
MMGAAFDAADFLHPMDLSARQQLERVPLLDKGVRAYLEMFTDRQVRQGLLANALRLGPRQLPDIYRLLPPICDAFGIPEPELYLRRGDANAFTVGHGRPAIVVNSGLLDDLAEDEVEAVLAHECGHILAEHILYRQMAQVMVRAGGTASAMGPMALRVVTTLGTAQIQTALFNWYRKSELTADRAAVAYMGGPDPIQRALFHITGVPKWMPGELSVQAFLQQADELEDIHESSKWERFLARGLDSASTHPMPTLRMRELTRWAESDRYRQVADIAEAARNSGALRRSCARCGKVVETGWSFCDRCGAAVPALPAEEVAGGAL